MCYNAQFKTLLFFLGKGTVIKGLENYSELQKIQLSSIVNHNQFFANISVLDYRNYKLPQDINIEKKVFLFSRFKPNNIMHLFHDDLFPLFLTFEYLCFGDSDCIDSFTLVFHDSHSPGPYSEVYKLFTKQTPIFLNVQQTNENKILCFKEMVTGLVQDGIFFQYGFNRPHGPVHNPMLNYYDIKRFSNFIKKKVIVGDATINKADIVIISRKKTRRILNIGRVVKIATDTYKTIFAVNDPKVVVFDLGSSTVPKVLELISNCKLLIGIHGAEMIFSIFSKSELIVVELFPFGIQPEYVSFLKPISELQNSQLIYFSWKNKNKNNSVAHPDAHPLFGGINHLNENAQRQIKSTQVVPPVECCNNPIYMYHMYQDTLVDEEFQEFLQSSLHQFNTAKRKSVPGVIEQWFYPHLPENVTCEFHSNRQLLISWMHPFNINDTKELEYRVFIQDEKKQYVKNILTTYLNLTLDIPGQVTEICPTFHLWISVVYLTNMSESTDSIFRCVCT
ncbi:hypothetical protein RUM44_010817 [Polyplax serrata]|uniref:Glycosyltransferase 61 catalytic domain-containing protein n=1 Tax=Polyplax serrata TaxID=468196 RepID=A0ABR1ANB3_POLSC